MVIVWRLRGNIIRTAVFWIVWHNVRSPQHTYMSSSYRSNRLGLSYWDSYAVYRGGCLELYYCNTVKWFWRSWRPVKIVPEMTYNVLSGTLILYTTTTEPQFCTLHCSQLGMIGNCPLISFSNFPQKIYGQTCLWTCCSIFSANIAIKHQKLVYVRYDLVIFV